jgi:hypothetical protein
MNQQPEKKEIKVEFPTNIRSGAYCNHTMIAHTKEEFVIDFMMIIPPTGIVTSRVIMSPGHVKRMQLALQENIKKYEAKFGSLTVAEEPTKGPLGFHA